MPANNGTSRTGSVIIDGVAYPVTQFGEADLASIPTLQEWALLLLTLALGLGLILRHRRALC